MPLCTQSSICLARYLGKDQDCSSSSSSERGIVRRFTFIGGCCDCACCGANVDAIGDGVDAINLMLPPHGIKDFEIHLFGRAPSLYEFKFWNATGIEERDLWDCCVTPFTQATLREENKKNLMKRKHESLRIVFLKHETLLM